ncbi:signal recognition particle-docking protein FtsY [Rhizobium sp. BK251]|uniref:signal recognition particle-docking protein FtsY n=1 Tax=Rhizobium sp. BK251 TaxID=2512125 RepID=UPI00104AF773|nr:signal recognition particle-docking protein FtsY [Rhizobium sp. BK251]TCL72814.1 signal recognition particle-docking protein FtsY [Rhizobium sp. BK251]
MALSFIKKVFTFGREKPVEQQPVAPGEISPDVTDAPPAAEKTFEQAIEAELEPRSRHEDLPVAEDPVLTQEMETAGGPAADLAEEDADEDDVSVSLPVAEQTSEIGLIPLSLLEAEAAAETAEDEPVAVDDDDRGGAELHDAPAPEASFEPPVENASETADADEVPVAEPVLPKGFATGPAAVEPEAPKQKLSWFQRLRAGLARTSSQLTGQIAALFTKRKLDDQTLQDLEDLLIQADLGVETAMRVTDTLASERYGKDVTGEDVSRIMASEIAKVLKPVAKPLQLDLSHKPHVILVVGVNGTGKTTTIGKLAAKLSGAGLKVMVAAGDTFRAAAIEQLKIWADRTKSEFIGTKLGADAAGLAYDAFQQARERKSDVLIIDTAGRLQNKAELMAELEKIVRVLGKLDPDAPHTVLQTLDATTGQNALNQVEIFRNVAGVNGLIMTKLDGTARGGILVAISAKHKLPVYFIGVGEGVDDLEPFEAEDFAQAIAGLG